MQAQRTGGGLIALNGGNALFEKSWVKAGQKKSARARAELIARANHRMQLDLFLPGPLDLALGYPFFKKQVDRHQLPVVASNLVSLQTGKPVFKTHVVRQLGPSRVVLIGLVEPETWPPKTGLRPTDPVAAAKKVIQKVTRPDDLVVIVIRTESEAAVRLAKALPRVSAVLVSEARAISFYPREVTTQKIKGGVDGSSVPVFSSGRQGEHLAQLTVFAVGGDSVLRGGVLFEDAREQQQAARKKLAQNPSDPEAQRTLQEASAILDTQRGKTHYIYQLVDLMESLPEDATTAKWRSTVK